ARGNHCQRYADAAFPWIEYVGTAPLRVEAFGERGLAHIARLGGAQPHTFQHLDVQTDFPAVRTTAEVVVRATEGQRRSDTLRTIFALPDGHLELGEPFPHVELTTDHRH